MDGNLEIIAHRINTVRGLKAIPDTYGAEIDIRAHGSELVLNHEPFQSGDCLEDYLNEYKHGTLVLNIKEAGIEKHVLDLVEERNIQSFFLLDVEYPYILQSGRTNGPLDVAVRFSEQETIQNVSCQQGRLKWVWIDCVTKNPVGLNDISTLSEFKTCLVCPSRWGRPKEIPKYRDFFKENMKLDAVMTELKYADVWGK